MFWATRLADPTRPVLDASGYSHRVAETDVYDSHDYEQDPEKFAANHAGLAEGRPYVNRDLDQDISHAVRGQPYFVSEFGGIWWNPDASTPTAGCGRSRGATATGSATRRVLRPLRGAVRRPARRSPACSATATPS